MKKLLALGMLLGALSLTSCKKDYTCSCSYNNGMSDTTFTVMYESAKKSDAEEACDASQASFQIVDANASCTLN